MISFSHVALVRNPVSYRFGPVSQLSFYFGTGPLVAQASLFKRGLQRASWPTGSIHPRTPKASVRYKLKIHRGGLSPLCNLISNLHEFESSLIWDCMESTSAMRRSKPPINRSPSHAFPICCHQCQTTPETPELHRQVKEDCPSPLVLHRSSPWAEEHRSTTPTPCHTPVLKST
jgi:hypothetical protein